MSFAYAPLAAVCLFSVGCAAANLFCMVVARFRHTKAGRRMSALCFFLSAAVASYTVLIFLRQNLCWFLLLYDGSASRTALFLLWAVAGVVIGIRWKLFLPVCAAVYLLATVFATLFLHRLYGKQYREYTISVQDSSIKINDVIVPYDKNQYTCLAFSVFPLSDTVLLPLPRVWYTFGAVSQEESDYFCTGYYTGADFGLELYVPIPRDTMLPALYTLRITPHGTQLDYELEKSL